MMNTKITSMLLAVVLALGLFAPQGSWALEKEEETYSLPRIIVGERKFPAKEGYKLIDDMFVSASTIVEDDVEWVDDPEIWAKAKELDPADYADRENPNVKYLNAYVSRKLGELYAFDDFISKGMERVFNTKYYEKQAAPEPGGIAWEGNRPWSQGFVVHSFDPDEGKVVVYGYENDGRYVALKADVNRFYYFYPRKSPRNATYILTDDNYALMIRRSKRPLMVGHNGYFYPDRLVTRAEFAQILVNLFELDPPKVTKTSFSDVKATDWFAPAVEAAKEAGLINGTPEGKFMPREHVTYEQVAVVLANYWKQTGLYQKRHNPAIYIRDNGGSSHIPIKLQQSYAREEVEFAIRLYVLPCYYGIDGSIYHYDQAVPRKEMANMLYIVGARHDLSGESGAKVDEKEIPIFKDWKGLEADLNRTIAVALPD